MIPLTPAETTLPPLGVFCVDDLDNTPPVPVHFICILPSSCVIKVQHLEVLISCARPQSNCLQLSPLYCTLIQCSGNDTAAKDGVEAILQVTCVKTAHS